MLVSSNPCAVDRALVRGTRPALDTGQLGIPLIDAPGDRPHPLGRVWSAPYLEVEAPAPVHDGIDGEAVDLSPPLRSAIRPAALRVRILPASGRLAFRAVRSCGPRSGGHGSGPGTR